MKAQQTTRTLPGWDRLRHGGLLFDASRLEALGRFVPDPLDDYTERQLRQRASAILDGSGDASPFVTFVLEQVCGLNASTGSWTRGSNVPSTAGRRAITGETVKPRHLWKGLRGARLPVFLDDGKRLGIGRSRRIVSQTLGWLRAGNEHLALLTNGRQWRLLFAGLDYEAWCEWDVDLWFEEGEISAQVRALRALLCSELWTPEAQDAAPPLLQAIRDTRKGQAELSEVLGERVREAVEILIRGHGDALSALPANLAEYRRDVADFAGVSLAEVADEATFSSATPADIYRAACRVAVRLVVVLFAESRDLLPRENALYHGSYGLNGLLEQLERDAVQGRALKESFAAWPRVLALFELVREGSHHPDLPVTRYGGELFAPGEAEGTDGLSQALAVFEHACFDGRYLPDSDVHEMLKLLTRTSVRIRQGRGSTRAVVPVDFSDLSSEYIGILYEGLLDYELKTAQTDETVVFLAVGDQPALALTRLEAMDDGALKALFTNLKDSSSDTDDIEEQEADTPPEQPKLDEMPVAGVAETQAQYVVAKHPQTDKAANQYDHRNLTHVATVSRVQEDSAPDERQQHRARAETWARRAALAAGLVKKRRGKDTPERRLAFQRQLGIKARQLVSRVVLPDEWYLVRWGGTRKGSGSFYTRPGLAIPTVQRTLRPLAYDPPTRANGKPDIDAAPARWTPKLPERILDLTVCDPACGSGSFPLAALRFLTDALYASLQHHNRIEQSGERSLVRLLGVGDTDQQPLAEELIPCPPDDDKFEPRLKAVLRRYVVERCIYAVDVDPLAVELCRLSLWIETMDRTLPFGFLDHKIKCGNSLIGAWFDQFRHYPAMAWKNREGGDKNHSNGVHFEQNARTKAIKAFVRHKLTPDLKLFLQGRDLFQEDLLEQAASAHKNAETVLAEMHGLPVQDAAERARMYRENLVGSEAWRSLKRAMDLWCACWFWPADEIEVAPLPTNFAKPPAQTCAVAERIAAAMRFFHWELEFPDVYRAAGSGFDAILGNPPWENLQSNPEEFFANRDPLFRTYGRLVKKSWQREQFSASAAYEKQWLDYAASFKYLSNWFKNRANPFGDPNSPRNELFSLGKGGKALHDRWRRIRDVADGFADPVHPFRLQMGRVFTYQLLLEQSITLLRDGGRSGLVIPSGIYSDAWSRPLREALLDHCQWEWLFGIDNRDGIFPIHRSYKFNPVLFAKGGSTQSIRTAFMRHKLEDWEQAETIATSYSREQIERFSPNSRAILEIQSRRDLKLLEKIYRNAVLLGDDTPRGWGIKYKLEFMMNTDAHLFPPRPQWEAKGYRPDEYSRWLLGDWRPIKELWRELGVDPSRPEPVDIELEDWLFDTTAGPERREAEAQFVHGHLLKPGDVARTDWRLRCAQPPYDGLPVARARIPAGVVLSREGDAWIREGRVEDMALPLMQGAMLHQFDFCQKGWVSGTGLQARWRPIAWANKIVDPQFLMSTQDAGSSVATSTKVAFRRVARNTDVRTMIASIIPRMPCGDKAAVLHTERQQDVATLALVLNSVAVDAITRLRVGGTQVDYHYARELPLLPPEILRSRDYEHIALGLNCASQIASSEWCGYGELKGQPWKVFWGSTPSARVHQRVLGDVLIAHLLGLDTPDLREILQSCDHPEARGDVKGFWRIDKDKEPELRHTVLTLVAFQELEAKIEAASGDPDQGIKAFLTQNHGEGWMLPETLRLADYGLGHDDRAKNPQPVASGIGPRFYDWQLVQTAEESWRECHLHARNLLGAQDYARLLADLDTRPPLFDRYPRRNPLKDTDYPRSPGVDAVILDSTALPEAAETRADYDVIPRPKGGQTDLFE